MSRVVKIIFPFIAIFLVFSLVFAEEIKRTDGNVHIIGSEINVNEGLHGDLYALGNTLSISQSVFGDIGFLGKSTNINGVINGDIRIASTSLNINNAVYGDALIAASTFLLSENARVTGNIRVWAEKEIIISGVVEGNVDIKGANKIVVSGTILGNLSTDGKNTKIIIENGRVDGNLIYFSKRKELLYIAEDGAVGGEINFVQYESQYLPNLIKYAVMLVLVSIIVYVVFFKVLVGRFISFGLKKTSLNIFIGLATVFTGLGLGVILLFTPLFKILGITLILVTLAMLMLSIITSPLIFGSFIWNLYNKEEIIDIKTTSIGVGSLIALSAIGLKLTIPTLVGLFSIGVFVRIVYDYFSK